MKFFFILLFSIFLISGCDDPPKKAVPCTTIDDCHNKGEFCINGICQKPEEIKPNCETKDDCQTGYYCNTDFMCVKDICTDDNYCGSGKICVNEDCIEGCRVKADCEDGFICNDQLKCEEKGDCRDNPDFCEQGYECNIGTGECEINNSCTTIADCPDNYECTNSECVEKERCSDSNPCTVAGEICKPNGFCGPDTGCEDDAYCIAKDSTKPACNTASGQCYECTKNEHCTVEGESCNTMTHKCQEGDDPGACESDSDCGLNKRCNTAVTPHECIDMNIGCDTDADCDNGMKCLTEGNRCVQCLSNADCEGEKTCSENTHICENPPTACTTDEDCNALNGETCQDGVCKTSGGNDPNGICADNTGILLCILSGWDCIGEDCVDPCANITCGDNSTCSGGTCSCDDGYKENGANCVSVCDGETCSGNGTCSVVSNEATCNCNTGFKAVGLTCVGLCEGETCSGHGDCSVNGDQASCTCVAGYKASGLTCVTLCEGETCSGHGTCSVTDNQASCSCDIGYDHNGEDSLTCVEHCELDSLSNPINSSKATATLVTPGDYLNLSTENDTCEEVEDWYKIELEATTKITVDIFFTHANGDLDLKFYNSTSDTKLVESITSTDNESIAYNVLTAGTYYIQVRFGRNKYSMKIRTATIQAGNPGNECSEGIECFGENASCSASYTANGYCGATCSATANGTTCMDTGICHNEECWRGCTTGDDSSCNRDDLVCADIEDGICIAKCYSNSDCYSNKCGATGHCEVDYRECDPVRNTGCDAGYRCYEFERGQSFCYPPGDKGEGAACDSTFDCGIKYSCLGNSTDGYKCTEICWQDTDPDCWGVLNTCHFDFSDVDYGYCN